MALVAAFVLSVAVNASASEEGATAKAERTEPAVERVAIGGVDWHTDYAEAYREARERKQMLLINFVSRGTAAAQQNVERTIESSTPLQQKLQTMTLLRLPSDAHVEVDGKQVPLLTQASFQEMHGKPGIAVIDLAHSGQSYYGHVVSAFPFFTGKYYRWKPEYLHQIVALPPGTITQRTMVWAVRIHPERPASTHGQASAPLATAAASHSAYQAQLGVQGHHQWDSRFHQVRAAAGAASATEIVAESWPNQTMIDSCLDCVDSWRHSSGHWGAVKRRHRLFGYDIRRGRNGIWYGTGIFAN